MKKTMTYEGVCHYCGQVQTVIANSQEEADHIITEMCNCQGAEYEKKLKAINKNAETIAANEPEEVIDVLKHLGILAFRGSCDRATIKIGNITYKVAINEKAQVKFARTETNKQELQE